MSLAGLDHLVLTVRDIDVSVDFYERALSMRRVEFGDGRVALAFADQKINLHRAGDEIAPHAARPTPGSADLCFLAAGPLEPALESLAAAGVEIEMGPVERMGAGGPLRSVYLRDPDGNLIELAERC